MVFLKEVELNVTSYVYADREEVKKIHVRTKLEIYPAMQTHTPSVTQKSSTNMGSQL